MKPVPVLLLLLSLITIPVPAADVPLHFEDEARQERYEELLEEIRCLVCQNQSLADSHADLAQDLRKEVHDMIAEGKTNEAITDYLVARYGDFVLFRPPMKNTTWVLWFGPFVLLLIGAVVIVRFVRSRQPAGDEEGLDRAQHERAARLLENGDHNRGVSSKE